MSRRKESPAVAAPHRAMDDDPVVQGILKAISLQRLRPGTKLGEQRLAEVFGTTRMQVRQALAHLASQNVITLYPNRGAFVWQPTVEDARELFQARRVLERATVEQLMAVLDPSVEAEIRSQLAREAKRDERERWEALTLTADFHLLIAQLAGNRVLLEFMQQIMQRNALIIATFEPPGDHDCSPDAHPLIAERIFAGDRQGAMSAMERHLHEIEDRLHLDEAKRDPHDIAAVFQDIARKPR